MTLPVRPLGHVVVDWLTRLSRITPGPLCYVETGTIRDREPFPGDPVDARSTLAVARWLRRHGGKGFSIDLSSKHVAISRAVLLQERLQDTFEILCGDGADILRDLEARPDFVLLDSDSDPEVTFREFIAVREKLRQPAFVMIDDIGRNGVNKGQKVLELMTREHQPWCMVDRFIAIIAFGSATTTELEGYRA